MSTTSVSRTVHPVRLPAQRQRAEQPGDHGHRGADRRTRPTAAGTRRASARSGRGRPAARATRNAATARHSDSRTPSTGTATDRLTGARRSRPAPPTGSRPSAAFVTGAKVVIRRASPRDGVQCDGPGQQRAGAVGDELVVLGEAPEPRRRSASRDVERVPGAVVPAEELLAQRHRPGGQRHRAGRADPERPGRRPLQRPHAETPVGDAALGRQRLATPAPAGPRA